MKKKLSFFCVLVFPFCLFAQNSSQSSRTEAPFLIPQTIFVGDSGRLVVPLSQAYAGIKPFVFDASGMLNETPELLIQRIELETRGGASRLLIDFIPYAPGSIAIPPLDFLFNETISAEDKMSALAGLEVQVASILNPSGMGLSGPASPLSVPGTSFLVYGTIVFVIVLLFFGIGGSLWGRRHFRELWDMLRRRHLLRVMTRFLQRFRRECFFEEREKPGFYLSLLSGELREFLSFFTGINCRPLTAGEFLDLSLFDDGEIPGDETLLNPEFLCGLFRNWDALRFSGKEIDRVDLFLALKETENFIAALDMVERAKPFPKFFAKAAGSGAGEALPAEAVPGTSQGAGL